MADKNHVYQSYEKIADWFDQHRSKDLRMEQAYLELVQNHAKKAGKVLDIGCGTGMPIARYFVDHGFDVTGVDASQMMLDKAKTYVPEAKLYLQDMRHLDLGEKFDVIILWHSSFHLPADDQRNMFPIIEQHINPNGVLLFTSGTSEGEVWGMNHGENLYHASLSPDEYRSLLKQHHFEVLVHNVEDPKAGGATVWAAQYIGNHI